MQQSVSNVTPVIRCALAAGPVAAGTVVNSRYTVQEVLGRGANAITYKATDNSTGRQVSSLLTH